jgi:type I restriction enzyme S subunit
MKRTPIEVGDVLLSTVGSYGHPAIVTEEKKFSFQRHIAHLKPKRELINSQYLHTVILSHDVQRQIEQLVLGVAQKTLNLAAIKSIKIPLPQMDEQIAFNEFVEQSDKSKFELKQTIDSLAAAQKALLDKCFR